MDSRVFLCYNITMFSQRQQLLIFTALVIFVALVIAFIFYAPNNPRVLFWQKIDNGDLSCVSEQKPEIVRGSSLSGILEDGSEITLLVGYYNCNEVKRDDLAVYQYAGSPDPIIKVIKGLPGDIFSLKLAENGQRRISVNNQEIKNSTGEFYELSEARSKMLALYEKDYGGVIPVNSFLILGNKADGTLDSIRFGLVDKSGFLGKAVIKK